jgi:hypothetical protein
VEQMTGLSSMVLFSSAPERSKSIVLGVVLASDASGFLESKFHWNPSLFPKEYWRTIGPMMKEIEKRLSTDGVKSSGLAPEELLREAWHDLGDSIFLTTPESCRFSSPENFLKEYLSSVLKN